LKPYNELFGGSNPGGLSNASSATMPPNRSLMTFGTDQKKLHGGSDRYTFTGLLGGRDPSRQSGGVDSSSYTNGLARQEPIHELPNAHSNSVIRFENLSRVRIGMDSLPVAGSLERRLDASMLDQGDKAICLVNRSPADTEKRQSDVADSGARPYFVKLVPVSPRKSLLPTKSPIDSSILKLLTVVEHPKTMTTETVFATGMNLRKRANVDEEVDLKVKRECVEESNRAEELLGSHPLTDESFEETPGAPTSCRLCNEPCKGRALEIHMRYVHKRFLCKICFNAFTLSCNLRRHMKLHAGVRPHACEHCDSSFSRSTDLRIHMRKHGVFESPEGGGRSRGSTTGDVVQRQCHLCPKVCVPAI